jgi:hypothetical protein
MAGLGSLRARRVRGRIPSAARFAAASGGALQYEPLRPAERIERALARTLDGPVHPALARERVHEHPAAFRLRLRGARLAGIDSLLLTRDRRVFDESHFAPEHVAASPTVRERLPVARRVRGLHMTIATPWPYGHFHWLLDVLPRLALLPLDELPDVPVLTPAQTTEEQRRALARAGLRPERVVPFDHGHVLADELIWPSRAGRTGNPPRWVVAWLRERLVPASGPRRRRLYVSRADAATRRVVNEEQVVAALAERGFERVVAGELPFADQLRLFAEAEAVVGPHGANLANLFAARAATVVELFAPDYVNACYYALSDAAGHDYWYLIGRSAGRDGDIAIDPDRLAALLDRALPARRGRARLG